MRRLFSILLILAVAVMCVSVRSYAPDKEQSDRSQGRVYLANGNYFDGSIECLESGEVVVYPHIGKLVFSPAEVEYIKYRNGVEVNWEAVKRLEDYEAGRNIDLDKFSSIIERASYLFGVEESLIKAVIKQESNFYHRAVSNKGAMGLMQLMPATASYLNVNDPFDPIENIEGGTRFLSHLLRKYDGNLQYTLAAYNAGSRAVAKYKGIPPYHETQTYVRKVIKHYKQYMEVN
ncbi:lytic transglycosylase domain-containing protein [Elusimicrobiota bacterium]